MAGINRKLLICAIVFLIVAGASAAEPSPAGESTVSSEVISKRLSGALWTNPYAAESAGSARPDAAFAPAGSAAPSSFGSEANSALAQARVFDPSELVRHSLNSHPKASAGVAQPAGSSDKWEILLTPYLFMASQKGTVGVGGRQVAVDARFADILDELNFGFMGAFEARKGKFVTFIDFEYMNVSDSNATPGPLFTDAQVRLKTYIFDPEFGYRFVENKKGSLDGLAGVRYMHLGNKFDLHPGLLPTVTIEDGNGWADPVIGLKGRVHLSPRWHLEAKGDLGGFGVGSHFTWQLFGGVGADVGKRSYMVIGYRYMDVDYSKNGFLFDMATRGPLIGFGIKF